jgi:sulfate-transporting ATPase
MFSYRRGYWWQILHLKNNSDADPVDCRPRQNGQLSGGERGRLHLAQTLISGGNVLLLDEPSNDLDVETLRALEDALLEFAGCVLVISHDRWFLDRIATHILAAEGDSKWTFFDGNYQEYEADKRKRLGEEGAKPKRIRYKPISR